MMKAFIETVVKQLVDYPDDVEVSEVAGVQTLVFELKLNPDDIRKVIGKQGRTIMAIRTLLESVGAKRGKRAIFEIIEPPGHVHLKRDDSGDFRPGERN
jgi:hypothetical protein